MENRHVDDLVDAYAIGALEPDEVDMVERHLEECDACRALADQARRGAELLLYAAPQVTPAPSLRARVLARIAQEKGAVSRSRFQPRHDVEPDASQLEPERERGTLVRLLRALRNEPAAAARIGALLRDLLADPQVIISPAAGTGAAPGASGRLIASPGRHDAAFVTSGLRPPETGKVYQVWLLRGGQPLPNALFAVDRSGRGIGIVHIDESWQAFDTVAVTPEPQAGSPAPTGPIVLAGALGISVD